jgi:hypothetical protein
MDYDITLPQPRSFVELPHLIQTYAERIRSLAKAAFEEDDAQAWAKAQSLLYRWNRIDFFNEMNTSLPGYNLMITLRNMLLAHQLAALAARKPVRLECYNDFTPDRAVAELKERAGSHRLLTHPYVVELGRNGMPPELATEFLENWYTDSDIFHLFIAALSLSTPLHLRGELYHNLYEELGDGDVNLAHPVIYRKSFGQFGRIKDFVPLTESMNVFNTQVYYTRLCGNYHMGLGALGFIEFNVPRLMEPIYQGLRKSGIQDHHLTFWPLHIQLDKEHGEAWFDEMHDEIDTPDKAGAMLEGGLRMLDARAGMFDGLWNRVEAIRGGMRPFELLPVEAST